MSVSVMKIDDAEIGNGRIAVLLIEEGDDQLIFIPRKWAGGYCNRLGIDELPVTVWDEQANEYFDLAVEFEG